MKKFLDGILVVEGTGDASYISSFVDCEIVITNGLDVPNSELEYLAAASKYCPIYLLSDPDDAGENIRKRVKNKIKVIDLFVDKKYCNKNGKHGVAECDKTALQNVLNPFLKEKNTNNGTNLISIYFLETIGVTNKEIYLFLGKKFNAGACNKKKLITRLNRLRVSEEDIRSAMEEYRNGN